MRQFFYQLLIGYIFIIIDLNFGIDFVPDVIGFIIIARAIQKYATSKYSKTATLLAYTSGLISIIEMPLLYSALEGFPSLIYGFISSIIQLLFYYYIFEVFFSFVQDTPHVKYTKKIKYLVVGSLWFMITFLYIAEHTRNLIIGLLFLVAGIIAVIGVIMFFVYCYKMMKYGGIMEFQEKQEKVEPS